jgi:hypothetical protein
VLYFTARSDLKTVEKVFQMEQPYITSYWALLAHAQKNNLDIVPHQHLSAEIKEENLRLAKDYTEKRRSISEHVSQMSAIAIRYSLGEPTKNLLAATRLPDFGEPNPQGPFNAHDKNYWLDTTHILIGAIKHRKNEQFWHLINPFYWIFEGIRAIFATIGLSKLLGQSVTNILSTVLTGATAIASPWIKDIVQAWLRHLLRK